MADIPDGADLGVAKAAVAWEIAKRSFTKKTKWTTKQQAEELIKVFNQVYYGIFQEPKDEE
jgi:hypothetical protein